MNFKKIAVLSALVFAVMLVAGRTQAATTWTVGNASSLPCTGNYPTITLAVAAASPGDTIQVCQGTYDEQVTVNKANLTIIGGIGGGVTSVKPTSVSPNSSR